MALVTIRELTIGFHGPTLLDGVGCQIEPGQHIGLLGRNGSGKTTLLRILRGEMQPDHGEVAVSATPHVALLRQDVPNQVAGTVAEVVAGGLPTGDDEHESAWRAEQQVKRFSRGWSSMATARVRGHCRRE